MNLRIISLHASNKQKELALLDLVQTHDCVLAGVSDRPVQAKGISPARAYVATADQKIRRQQTPAEEMRLN